MNPRLTFITLGVPDLERAIRFYADGLGFPRVKSPPETAFFDLGSIRLALYRRDLLAMDAGVPPGASDFANFALAYNVGSRAEADRLLGAAAGAGGRITRSARPTEWGGYAGWFADPDGFVWEVAWNPGSRMSASGVK